MKAQTISLTIDAPMSRVYEFAAREKNLPRWVPSFFRRVWFEHGAWRAETPLGQATVAFAPENPFGVLDHRLRLDGGTEFFNPMRVVANGEGSELMFTLFQGNGMSDDDFVRDAALVRGDLLVLKRLLEAPES